MCTIPVPNSPLSQASKPTRNCEPYCLFDVEADP